jgi:hypothetical protein
MPPPARIWDSVGPRTEMNTHGRQHAEAPGITHRDEISHGEVVSEVGDLLILTLELSATRYHQLLRRVPDGERLDW